MTSQVTNRGERGSTSCCVRSRKFQAFTEKELETVRAAQELLGVPTTGGGSARPGGGGRGSQRSQISLQSHPECTKMAPEMASLPHLTKYTPATFFEDLFNFKIFRYLRRCGVIPVQSFGSHLHPQPPELGLISQTLVMLGFHPLTPPDAGARFILPVLAGARFRFPDSIWCWCHV
jgi:hypothetical protein